MPGESAGWICLLAGLIAGCSGSAPPRDAASVREGAPGDLRPADGRAPDADPGTCIHPQVKKQCAAGWCTVPAGCFFMGSPTTEPGHTFDEQRHAVTLTRAFQLMATEVTQASFKARMGYNPSKFASCSSCPVDTVGWDEAVAYCNQLSADASLAPCYSCTGSGPAVSCAVAEAYRQPHQGDEPRAVWAGAAGEPWIVGQDGMVLRSKGGVWKTLDASTHETLNAVWGSSASDVWIVGDGGLVLHFDGTTLAQVKTPTAATLRGVWGAKSSDVWAVGLLGTILHYDGAKWSTASSPTASDLSAVWGSGAGEIWAVGGKGTLLRHAGSSWASRPSGVKADLHAVWGSGAGDVWVVGAAATLLRYDGARWTKRSTGTSYGGDLYAIWGSGPTDIWAGGEELGLLHHDGKAWTRASLKPASAPQGVILGLGGRGSAQQVWAVGTQETYLQHKQGAWAPFSVSSASIFQCAGYRLPTEAEWEYAYRAGTTTPLYSGEISALHGADANADKIAWYKANSGNKTHPVGKKAPNAWGLYDMAGNVSELAHDGFFDYLGTVPLTDPIKAAKTGKGSVMRGGVYFDTPGGIRASMRAWYTPPPDSTSGFRCARTLGQ